MGDLEQLILFSVVQLEDNACGVTIREAIEERTGRVISVGAIYTTLGRLENRGLVASSVEETVSGRTGRPRKYYMLEPAGARKLMAAYNVLQAMAGDLIPRLADLADN